MAAKQVRKQGTKVYYTAHGFHFYKGAPKKNWIVFYPIEKYFSRMTDKLITITKEDYHLASQKFHCKVERIHGVGVDENRYHSVLQEEQMEIRKQFGFTDGQKIILCVAGERMKPRIFIGSSKESVKIAEKVKSLLDGEYVCQLWCDNFFDLGQCTYHELLKKSLSFDYAIFIGGKDDYVRRESDRTHKYAARDNVYLEFGLYAGILTYARCFFLIQEGCQIASDLLGVNVVFFDKMQDLSKKILTITEKIQKEQKVARISLLPSTSLAVGYFENFLKPVSQAIQKLDEICIAGKKYDVKNSDKRLEVAIPAKVSEDLRMWSEYVYENHAVEKVTVDSSIRKIGVNIDYGKLENTGDLTVIDVPLTLSAAYRSVELALGVDYIGIEEIKELAKEKELNNFIKTVNNLILEDIYTRKSVSVRKVYKDKL